MLALPLKGLGWVGLVPISAHVVLMIVTQTSMAVALGMVDGRPVALILPSFIFGEAAG